MLGQSDAEALVLAVEIGVARQCDNGPDSEGVARLNPLCCRISLLSKQSKGANRYSKASAASANAALAALQA